MDDRLSKVVYLRPTASKILAELQEEADDELVRMPGGKRRVKAPHKTVIVEQALSEFKHNKERFMMKVGG